MKKSKITDQGSEIVGALRACQDDTKPMSSGGDELDISSTMSRSEPAMAMSGAGNDGMAETAMGAWRRTV